MTTAETTTLHAATPQPSQGPRRAQGASVTVPQAPFAAALGTVGRVIDAKNPIAVLQRVLLQSTATGLRLVGGDHGLTVAVDIPGDTLGFPPIAVSANLLASTVSALPDGDVRLEMEKQGVVHISAPGFRSRFLVIDGASYPPLALATDPWFSVRVRRDQLAQALGDVIPALPKDDTREMLAGVRIRIADGRLELVSCDGTWGARRLIPVEGGEWPTESKAATIPSRTARELRAVMAAADKADHVAEVILSEHRLVATVGAVLVTSPLIVLPYPAFERFTAEAMLVSATVDRRNFIASLRAVAPVAAQDAGTVRVTHGGGRTVISADAPEVGRSEHAGGRTVVTRPDAGASVDYHAGYQFLAGALDALRGEETIEVELNPGKASVVVIRGTDDPAQYHVIAPRRRTAANDPTAPPAPTEGESW